MKGILALDIGTTAVKAALFTDDLKLAGLAIKEYTLLTPAADIVELNPAVYWDNAVDGIREVLAKTSFPVSEIYGITCTTQGETLIPVDQDINPLCNAIVWLDARAEREGSQIRDWFTKEHIYSKTGVPEINGYTPAAKLLWLKNNKPGIYRKAYKILLVEDFLVAKLCGAPVSNPALMCSTGYFDINTCTVWEELLEACGIEKDKIPEALPCGTPAGRLTRESAAILGLPESVMVSTGAMDQIAGAIGSGNIREGILAETTGTAQVIATARSAAHTAEWKPVFVYNHGIPGMYLDILIVQSAGIVFKWFREEFCADLSGPDRFYQMDELAAKEPAGSKGLLLYPHFTGIQFPVTNNAIRGSFVGVGLDTTRGCFIRAIMESIGYTMRECMELLNIKPSIILSMGGGSKSRLWNQIKADICGTEIVTMRVEETALLGAAILGGTAAGIVSGIESACAMIARNERYQPREENKTVYSECYARYRQLYPRLVPLFTR